MGRFECMHLGPGRRHHIALYINSMEGGGAERAILNLACGLVDHNFRVDLVLSLKSGSYLAQLPGAVRIFDLNAPQMLSAANVLRFRRYLLAERPQIVISALKQSTATALWAKIISGSRAKFIPTVHGMLWEPDKRPLYRIGRKLLYSWADEIVAVSGGVAEDFARYSYVPREKLTVIYNPIVAPDLLARAAEPANHPWLDNSDLPVVISIGRLIPEKDHTTLIRAFSLLRERIPSRLIILGEGYYRTATEAFIREQGLEDCVSLPGFAENPYAYLARSSVFVLSSTTEGFGNVIVEALAVGTPVVSTDCYSGPSEILRDGEFGKLVPVGDAAAMAEAMEEQIRTPPPKDTLIRRAADFNVEVIVGEYLKLFERHLGRGSDTWDASASGVA